MRAMKDSGIAWIGEIPEGWRTCAIKQVMRNKSLRGFGEEQVLSLYRDYGVVPKDSRDDNHNVTSEDTSNYKLVEVGDFVINKMKAWQGSMAVSNYRGIISPAYYVCYFTREDICKKYIHYLLRNDTYKTEYMRLSTGLRIGQWDLNIDDFLHISILLPPLSEQEAIAAFLDTQCAEVDELLKVQEKFIQELKAYKQALITETVTKGLTPNTPMKHSGVDWIGEIPEGWKVLPIKSIYQFGKGLSITKGNLIDRGIPVISYGQIHSKHCNGVHVTDDLIRYVSQDYLETDKSSLVKIGDVIFADTSEDLDGCGNCIYIDRNIRMFAGYHTIIASLYNEEGATKYLAYLFKTDCWRKQIRMEVNGVNLFSISQRLLSSTSVILPPLSEQETIAKYLDQKCAEIDQLIALKQQKIDELQDYRKSLIYEYVTGKRPIPHPIP